MKFMSFYCHMKNFLAGVKTVPDECLIGNHGFPSRSILLRENKITQHNIRQEFHNFSFDLCVSLLCPGKLSDHLFLPTLT